MCAKEFLALKDCYLVCLPILWEIVFEWADLTWLAENIEEAVTARLHKPLPLKRLLLYPNATSEQPKS